MSVSIKNHSKILIGPYQYTVDITNKCNLRCLHCYNHSGDNICIENEMTDNELIDLVEDIATTKPLNVCFCGGEPLLRKNILIKLIKILNANGTQVSFVSNGILLTKEVAHELKEAGLSRAQISIDGLEDSHNKLRGKSGVFKKAVEALQNLRDEKIETGVAFTPTRWNIDELSKIIDLCIDLSVREFRVQETMPIGRGEKNSEEILPTQKQYRSLLKVFNARKRQAMSENIKIRLEWGDPVDHFIRFVEYNKECCPFVSIKADGGIAASIYLPITTGNVKRHKLTEYWNNGLGEIWKIKKLQEVANTVRSINELCIVGENLPKTFKDKDIVIDIIDMNRNFEEKCSNGK